MEKEGDRRADEAAQEGQAKTIWGLARPDGGK